MKKQESKGEKRYGFLNVIIVVLTVILFFMVVGLFASTAPRKNSYYDEKHTSEDLLRVLNYSGYQRLLEYKLQNDALGETADNNKTLTVPNAIADYYKAAVVYTGYKDAGREADVSDEKAVMDKARTEMSDYAYIADEIDEYLGLD